MPIALELENLPPETVIDGELVALDRNGVPRFNLLQNYRSGSAHLMYFAFDILAHKGKDVTKLALSERRELLRSTVKRGSVTLALEAQRTVSQPGSHTHVWLRLCTSPESLFGNEEPSLFRARYDSCRDTVRTVHSKIPSQAWPPQPGLQFFEGPRSSAITAPAPQL